MTINFAGIYHESKSKYAYAFDKDTLHIRIRTAKNDIDDIKIIYGDPFNWHDNKWVPEKAALEMVKEYTTKLFDYWFIAIKPKYKRIRYGFILIKGQDNYLFGCERIEKITKDENINDLFNFFNFPYINSVDIYTCPKWVNDTVWYHIFPERFCNGNKGNDPINVLEWDSIKNVKNDMFFGGDLDGIIHKLDYVKSLGINGIYLTPIFKSPSNHKYDTEDYFQVDSQFGDNETLKRLIDEAHKQKMKVMLDAVFNHCGYNHPFFQDVLKNGQTSEYKDWFYIKRFPVFEGNPEGFKFIQDANELNYETFAFTPFMPKWNTGNPQVKDYLLSVATYWIREYDIDAWRLDVSNEVDHAFWKDFRRTCDNIKKDFFIVGENWDEANPWLQPDQMHSVMNYPFKAATWKYFGDGSYNANDFINHINSVLTMYPKNINQNLFNLLDSHDTARILHVCGDNKDKVKLAYVFQLTFTGTPCIYYGSEIGLNGGHDPDNRRCMIWDQDKQDRDLFKHIQTLIKLRNTYSVLKSVDIKWMEANESTNHLIYRKEIDNEVIYIIINNQNENLMITNKYLNNKSFHDIYNDEIIEINDVFNVRPYGFYILKSL